MNILIKELPETEVAFIRRSGSYYEPQEHWGKLINWAISNGLYTPQQSFIGISLDNPDLVKSKDCRHDACVTIPNGFDKEKHKDMKFKRLDGGLYALYHFYDTPEKLNFAYKYMFGEWLPNSHYEADYDRFNLEFNMNNPSEDPEGKCKVDLLVPIKKEKLENLQLQSRMCYKFNGGIFFVIELKELFSLTKIKDSHHESLLSTLYLLFIGNILNNILKGYIP